MITLTIFLITLLISIGLICFNAYFLQVIYNLIIISIFQIFEITLPPVNYGIFILLWIMCNELIKIFSNKSNEQKKYYDITKQDEVSLYLTKLIANTLNILFSRIFCLFIIYFVYRIILI